MLPGQVHAAEKPADPQCNEGAGIRLGLNHVAKPLIEISRGISRLAIGVLRGTGKLVCHTSAPGLDVACCAPEAFFDLAAQIARSSLEAIFIHVAFLQNFRARQNKSPIPSFVPVRPRVEMERPAEINVVIFRAPPRFPLTLEIARPRTPVTLATARPGFTL
jgi:hypothetical protein